MRKDGKKPVRKFDLKLAEPVICVDRLDGSTEANVYRIHAIVKTGPRLMIESELQAYRQLGKLLKRNKNKVFPRIVPVISNGSKFASLWQMVPLQKGLRNA